MTRVGLESFLEEVLTEDMSCGNFASLHRIAKVIVKKLLHPILFFFSFAGPHECPFLYARIFTSVAKFSSMVPHAAFFCLEHILFWSSSPPVSL